MFKELFTEAKLKPLRKITSAFVKEAEAMTDLKAKRKFVLDYIGDEVNTASEAKFRRDLPTMSDADIDKALYQMLLSADGLGTSRKRYGR